jgi:hypothetical protein
MKKDYSIGQGIPLILMVVSGARSSTMACRTAVDPTCMAGGWITPNEIRLPIVL